ncbi:hypothetical protein [Candidatus Avelusimicrobium sp.]|uniref:hypothetical protein n=1 Tax=Candidatus Avelusimicrobium sp. TaxID=3048833 RepID=UPI003F7F6750
MPITLNEIFNLNEEEIKNSKIELNMKAGKDGESFLDRWLRRRATQKRKWDMARIGIVLSGGGMVKVDQIFGQGIGCSVLRASRLMNGYFYLQLKS